MTTTAHLKPGDVVRQPVHGYGIVYVDGTGETLVMHCSAKGRISIADLDGWERVETCTADAVRILEDYQQIVSKSAGVVVRDAVVMMTTAAYEAYRGREIVKPGHVQVRVDDLDLSGWPPDDQYADADDEVAAIRVAKAQAAQRTESAPTADEQDANVEAFPHTVMVELRCPHGCGAPVRAKLSTDGYSFPEGGAWPRLVAVPQHTCQPPQPDEPTGLGAVVEVGGKRFVRTDEDGHPWIDNVAYWHSWDEITARGPVTVLSEGLES